MARKLFLLDAMALIYRAHFVFIKNPRVTTTGINTSAVYGFMNTLTELLDKEEPTHIGVAFESRKPTFREEKYAAYKANREAAPEDIITAVPYVKQLLEALGIPCLSAEGYEADDVIGTLAKQAGAEGYEVYMVTPDKDYAQLIGENIFMYRPGSRTNKLEVIDYAAAEVKFGVPPERVVDFLGLKGDAVDNIPGVPKIGDKTAVQLIEEFGGVEEILANIDNIQKKSIRESLREHQEQARLSKYLATIATDAPVDFEPDKLERSAPDKDRLRALFQELEFRTVARRLLGEDDAASVPASNGDSGGESAELKTIENTDHTYYLVKTADERAALIKNLTKQDVFCFDTETTSLEAEEAALVGMSFSWKAGEGWFVLFPEDETEARAVAAEFKSVFEKEDVKKVAQNIKYDLRVLSNYGIEVKGQCFDTMLAHYVCHSDQRHNMDVLAAGYLNYQPIAYGDLAPRKNKKETIDLRALPEERLRDYACEDADITFQLYVKLSGEVVKQGLEKVFYQIDMPLAPVLAEMEREGVRIDPDFLAEASEEMGAQAEQLTEEIFQACGEEFNLNSPKQLGEILFDKMGLPAPKKTKTGQYSTSEQVLQDLAAKGHDLPDKILAYRHLTKLKSTYVDALPGLINARTGRLHTSYNQAVTVTGRLSSNNPNLQNIPVKTEMGRSIRKAFVARDADHVLIAADYSQIELRIMAGLSGDEAMVAAFNESKDIHAETAARVFGVAPEEVSREMRGQAKMVNFGLIYGISAFGLANRLGIARGEAKDLIDNYFAQYPGVKKFMDESVNRAREKGYAETPMGRRHYLRDIHSRNQTTRGFAERNAINTPIQGAAADMIKLAMIDLAAKLKAGNFKTRMTMQVHDELVFDAPKAELEEVKPLIIKSMENAMEIGVPVEANVGVADNWLDAH